MSANELYTKLFQKAMEGEPDCGGLMSYNFYSGEPVVGVEEGRPRSVRRPDAHFTLANFMRTHLQAALAALKAGLDILARENVKIDAMYGHGGSSSRPPVWARPCSAAAIHAPVYVMSTAGEGGPWGMALLAAYLVEKQEGETLEEWLAKSVFADTTGTCLEPDGADAAGFDALPGSRSKAGLSRWSGLPRQCFQTLSEIVSL